MATKNGRSVNIGGERERERKDPVTLLSFAALLELPFFASLLQREKGKEKRKEERGKEGS